MGDLFIVVEKRKKKKEIFNLKKNKNCFTMSTSSSIILTILEKEIKKEIKEQRWKEREKHTKSLQIFKTKLGFVKAYKGAMRRSA